MTAPGEHLEPSDPVAAYLDRGRARQLDPAPMRDVPDSWTHLCPTHYGDRTRVRVDQDVTGDGWVHPCPRGCLPGEVLELLRSPD